MPLLLLSSCFQKHWLYNMVDATSIYLQMLQRFTTHNLFCMTDFSCTSTCTIYVLITAHFTLPYQYKAIHICHVHVTYSPRGCCKLVASCTYMQIANVAVWMVTIQTTIIVKSEGNLQKTFLVFLNENHSVVVLVTCAALASFNAQNFPPATLKNHSNALQNYS